MLTALPDQSIGNGITSINPYPFIFRSHYNLSDIWKDIKGETDVFLDFIESPNSIYKNSALEVGGVSSVGRCRHDPPHGWRVFDDLTNNHIPSIVDQVWDMWSLKGVYRNMTESWINRHPPKATTLEHHHHNVTVAICAYLDVPEGSGNLQILNPLHIFKYAEPVDDGYEMPRQDHWIDIPVKTNDVVYFPGWLKHRTGANNSDSNRYVMTMNVTAYEMTNIDRGGYDEFNNTIGFIE